MEPTNDSAEAISGVSPMVNPTKDEYNAFLLKHKELRIFQDNHSNFYVFPAGAATHFEFEKKLGITHKIGTNLGITSNNNNSPSGLLPANWLACMAAPNATTSSGFKLVKGSQPNNSATAV